MRERLRGSVTYAARIVFVVDLERELVDTMTGGSPARRSNGN